MRIMYLLFSFSVGGTERLVVDICNEMIKRGNYVHLYIVNNHISKELLSTLDNKVIIMLQGRKRGKGGRISTLFKVSNYVKQNRIDIIHCNSLNAPDLLYLCRVQNPKTRIVYTVHGMGQYQNLGKAKVIARNWICDSIIGISHSVTNDLIENGANSEKTICIYNGIQFSGFINNEYKTFDRKSVTIGCLARIMPSVKGQDVLLHAIPILINDYPEIKVVFAGGVADEQKDSFDELKAYIKSQHIEGHAFFIGAISNPQEFYKNIDICVVPSRSEGFGLTLVEAMSMGVPCVASDIGGLSEIIQLEKTGLLFKVGDSKSLYDALKEVIENYSHHKRMANDNKDRIINDFKIEKMCDSLYSVYSK